MVKRTSLNLDLDLVAQAKEALGTKETTETVHRALQDVVKRGLREQLVEHVFDFDNDELERVWLPENDQPE